MTDNTQHWRIITTAVLFCHRCRIPALVHYCALAMKLPQSSIKPPHLYGLSNSLSQIFFPTMTLATLGTNASVVTWRRWQYEIPLQTNFQWQFTEISDRLCPTQHHVVSSTMNYTSTGAPLFNPKWISYCIHYQVWDEITHPFSNYNGAAINFNHRFTGHIITYPCWDIS